MFYLLSAIDHLNADDPAQRVSAFVIVFCIFKTKSDKQNSSAMFNSADLKGKEFQKNVTDLNFQLRSHH